jgi:hypothetical protein
MAPQGPARGGRNGSGGDERDDELAHDDLPGERGVRGTGLGLRRGAADWIRLPDEVAAGWAAATWAETGWAMARGLRRSC